MESMKRTISEPILSNQKSPQNHPKERGEGVRIAPALGSWSESPSKPADDEAGMDGDQERGELEIMTRVVDLGRKTGTDGTLCLQGTPVKRRQLKLPR